MSRQAGPDFVCIGAQKSGTTWLYENLAAHAEVWVPPVKEFHYFDRLCIHDQLLGRWDMPHPHGVRRYAGALRRFDVKSLRWLIQYYGMGMDKAWYVKLFDERHSSGKVSGDITPGYSTLEERGVRFASSVLKQDVRIIFIIRHPVYRAWSAAKMLFRFRNIDPANVPTEQLVDLLKSPAIKLGGQYSRIIPLWKKYFQNFYVLSYDQLSESPREFLSEISRIIGVSNKWNELAIGRRVWADAQNMPIPENVWKVLVDQYSGEVKSLMSMNECEYAKTWCEEISKPMSQMP